MPVSTAGDIRYFAFDLFAGHHLKQAIFMRQGGISPAPWDSLNTATSVGDSRENIIQNRARIFEAAGRKVDSLYDVWQIHSNHVICTEAPRGLDTPPIKADAIITDRPEVTLYMRFADCVPIFLYDPEHRVAGIVHAGWKGTVNKIAKDAVEAMHVRYKTDPSQVLAGIGPSIGPDHYEIGPDVKLLVDAAFQADAVQIIQSADGLTKLDLWKANTLVLNEVGVKEIEAAGICTACNTNDWFSHRAEHGKTGRFGAIFALED
ncbi:MAG TPA: peptidoglycan editing factor PgeF [Anaerolineaceae bacterium]|nr:peptidoglycan editing factor PgeF [Anaerolineaceae bacterium]